MQRRSENDAGIRRRTILARSPRSYERSTAGSPFEEDTGPTNTGPRALSDAVTEMKKAGALETVVDRSPGFFSCLFLVPKKNGSTAIPR